MKDKNEIRKMRQYVAGLAITGAGAIAMFTYAGYLFITEPASVNVKSPVIEISSPAITTASKQTETKAIATASAEVKNTAEVKKQVQKTTLTSASAKEKKSGGKYGKVEEIQSFEVSCNNGSIVFKWVTEGQGKYAYEIEKANEDGTFEVFLRAPQPEKKDGLNYYNVEEIVDAGEAASYRLKRVIGKNKFEYTEPVTVQCVKKPAKSIMVDVFPAGYGAFRILVNTPVEDHFKVTLFDSEEQEIKSNDYDAAKGSNEFKLEAATVTKGNYMLRITNGSFIKERKITLK
ncbi:MAG TPA: hypothetical protein VFW78_09120 [Bacteroidia bacterium]|nr:hypothetical protein [Bacteroidia bacterium]